HGVATRHRPCSPVFGRRAGFAGGGAGVRRTLARETTVTDITHGIPPQAVLQGAVVLERSVPYMPISVHLAVVDPGVGSDRRPIAVQTRGGRVFVGPDNGLLMRAADHDGVEAARALPNPRDHLGDGC